MGVIGRGVSGFIPQTPRRNPEEHDIRRFLDNTFLNLVVGV